MVEVTFNHEDDDDGNAKYPLAIYDMFASKIVSPISTKLSFFRHCIVYMKMNDKFMSYPLARTHLQHLLSRVHSSTASDVVALVNSILNRQSKLCDFVIIILVVGEVV